MENYENSCHKLNVQIKKKGLGAIFCAVLDTWIMSEVLWMCSTTSNAYLM